MPLAPALSFERALVLSSCRALGSEAKGSTQWCWGVCILRVSDSPELVSSPQEAAGFKEALAVGLESSGSPHLEGLAGQDRVVGRPGINTVCSLCPLQEVMCINSSGFPTPLWVIMFSHFQGSLFGTEIPETTNVSKWLSVK